MEAHGGYLCRLEEIEARGLARLARRALIEDEQDPESCSLQVSLLSRAPVVRLAYDGPFTYGRRGARWYETHHALARLLSRELNLAVHAYVLDPEELEEVVGYGGGHRVGGERLRYEDAELPDEELDDLSFERLKARWPIGHLGTVLGVSRDDILRIPRSQTVLLELDGTAPRKTLPELFASELKQAPEGLEHRPTAL